MRRPEEIPIFSKALLAGALTGVAASIINGIYDIIFRGITGFMPAIAFNFVSIPLLSMIVLTVLGLLFFVFIKYFNTTAFIIVILLLIIAVIMLTAFSRSTINESAFYGDHGLISGFVVLSGLLAVTLLPYLYQHPKLFI